MSHHRPRGRRAPNRRPAAPAARSRAPRPAGGRRPAAAPATAPRGLRGAIERISRPALIRLTTAPRWLIGLVPAAVLLAGLLAPLPWGPALLALVVVFLAWLLFLAWPKLEPRARAVRAGVIVLLLAVVLAQAADLI